MSALNGPRQANLVLIAYASSEGSVSPEPLLLAHTSSESRGNFRQKARSLAPLNGWACAVKICNDGMLEDTNSLDEALNDSRRLTALRYFLGTELSGVYKPLLENAFSNNAWWTPLSSSAIVRECIFKNQKSYVTLLFRINAEYVHFYNVYTNNDFLWNHTSLLNAWSLLCHGHIRSYATLIAEELHVLQYAPYYGVFEMLNVDKMEHWDSSGVQQNKIVLKIHHTNTKMIYKTSETLQNS